MVYMHISINKQYLLKPLQIVCSILDRKTTSPILNNVLINCSNNNLLFISTDMELQICYKLAVDNLQDFDLTVAAKKLLEIIKVLSDGTINWKIYDNKLKIQQAKINFELHTLPSKDFPIMSSIDINNTEFTISQKQFKHQLQSVSFAMAIQDVRYYLNGMLFKLEDKKLNLVATDGHRMAYSCSTIDCDQSTEVILSRKTVLELLRLLDDSNEKVKIQVNQQQIKFNFGDIELISKLIDGKFPEYSKLIPDNHPFKLNVARQDLATSLQRVNILANDKLRAVKFILSQNGLSLFANNVDNEEVQEEINASYNGDGFEVSFNISYWIEVINILKQPNIDITFNNSNTGALLFSLDDVHEYKYIVMPIRI